MSIMYLELRGPSKYAGAPTVGWGPLTLWTSTEVLVDVRISEVACNASEVLRFGALGIPYAGLYWGQLVVVARANRFSVRACTEHAHATTDAALAYFNRIKNEFPFTRANTLRVGVIKTMLYAGLTDEQILSELDELTPASVTGHQNPIRAAEWLARAHKEIGA